MPTARQVGVGVGLAGGLAAAIGAVTLGRDEFVRLQVRQIAALARPVESEPPAPPVPPPLLPGRLVTLPGRGEVFARDSGPGSGGRKPTVLLLHGWTVSADINFFRAYEALTRDYRVIALDHRGHGRGIRSTEPFSLEDCADDAAALVEELDAGPVTALGYSMGGPIAMLAARRHPGLVAGLVAQATALEWNATKRDRRAWRFLTLMEVGLRTGTGDGFVERLLAQTVQAQPELRPLKPWLVAEIQRGLQRQLVDAGWALSKYDAREWAGSLGLPAAVCVTNRDRLVPPDKQRTLAKTLAADVLDLDGDHDVCLIGGEQYAAVTKEAVDRVAVRAGLL